MGVSCPPAIFRGVWAIVVDAIKTVAGGLGFWPHVCQEVDEAVRAEPAFADRDSSTAPVGESLDLGVIASTFHRCPGSPLWRGVFAVFAGVLVAGQAFAAEAATTECETLGKQAGVLRDVVAAVAKAAPKTSRAETRPIGDSAGHKRTGIIENDKSAEALAGEIFAEVVGVGRFGLSHDAAFREKVGCGQGRRGC